MSDAEFSRLVSPLLLFACLMLILNEKGQSDE